MSKTNDSDKAKSKAEKDAAKKAKKDQIDRLTKFKGESKVSDNVINVPDDLPPDLVEANTTEKGGPPLVNEIRFDPDNVDPNVSDVAIEMVLEKLTDDLLEAAKVMKEDEVNYLVFLYYTMQKDRIIAKSKMVAAAERGIRSPVLNWSYRNFYRQEKMILTSLDVWTKQHALGRWCQAIWGIGPVLTAALMSMIDMEEATTASKVWAFAGLDPNRDKKVKGKKLPYNAMLKTVAWKIGQSFVKVSGKPDSVYGQLYNRRKAVELEKDARGDYREQALAIAEAWKKSNKTSSDSYKKYYSQGHLSQAHIGARAARWATKIFLSHFHSAACILKCNRPAPEPYALVHLNGHHDRLEPEMPYEDPGIDFVKSKAA